MKPLLLLLAAICALTSAARSATLQLSGRIEGRLAGSVFDDINYHMLDFYWFRVPEQTEVTIQWCITNGPGGGWGTSLDMHIYPNADANADLNSIVDIAGAGDFCTSRTFLLDPGNYIFDAKPRDTDYDGADGLVPFSASGKDFFHFDYNATITGNVELYEMWIGQTDKTFLITIVPEPGAGAMVLALFAAASMHRGHAGASHLPVSASQPEHS